MERRGTEVSPGTWTTGRTTPSGKNSLANLRASWDTPALEPMARTGVQLSKEDAEMPSRLSSDATVMVQPVREHSTSRERRDSGPFHL